MRNLITRELIYASTRVDPAGYLKEFRFLGIFLKPWTQFLDNNKLLCTGSDVTSNG